jgi:pyruvate dehydrogenase E2 component (dihydrolipoamide acetyltransferase)
MPQGTAKGETTTQELTRAQQGIARRTAESKATIPHFVLETEVDMEARLAPRGGGDAAPTAADAVIRACGLALREQPLANGAYRDGRFELYSRVNIAVAVASAGALVFPTIFDADRKALDEIAAERGALVQRVHDGVVTPPELSGATFTVFDLGDFAVTRFAPVVSPSQAAALAAGAVTPRPVIRDSEVVVRRMMSATLACDHRILYGAQAAEFLTRVRALLEEAM